MILRSRPQLPKSNMWEAVLRKILSKIPTPKLPDFELPPFVKTLHVGPGVEFSRQLVSQVGKMLNGGTGFVTTTLRNVPFFGSVETTDAYDSSQYDEKHYFLIPHGESETGFAVYVMRCLPEGVPPINDLPKQRFVHLPGPHALPMLQTLLQSDARSKVQSESQQQNFVSDNLGKIIDEAFGQWMPLKVPELYPYSSLRQRSV